MRLLAALMIIPLLAGCLSGDTDDLAVGTERPVLDDALDLWDQGAPAANVHLLGHWQEGGAQEIDAWEDLLFVDRGSTVHILDVARPEDPREVGQITGLPAVLDVKVTDDGRWAIIGDDAEGSTDAASLVGEAAGTTGPLTGGFYVVDVSDPSAPQHVSTLLTGPRRGPHMVAYANTSVGELVLGANADVSINAFDGETGELTPLARYSPMLTDWNRGPEVFDVLYQGWAHDMFVLEDDQDGVLMYVANWDAGLRIVDLNDPSSPKELGKWMDFPEGHEGNLHTVHTEWVGDRRITVGSTEVGFAVVGGVQYAKDESRGVVYVWDTTDPADIRLLGTWENPDGAPAGRSEMPGEQVTSTHNLHIVDGKVYLAHYGLGVWVLDVSTPQAQADPQVLGYYLAEGQNTWDVLPHHGVVWTGGALGAMGLHFAPDEIGPQGVTGTA